MSFRPWAFRCCSSIWISASFSAWTPNGGIHLLDGPEDLQQGAVVRHIEHVGDGACHHGLEADAAGVVDLVHLLKIAGHRAAIQAVVHHEGTAGPLFLLLEVFQRSGGRHGQGHLQHGGDAAHGSTAGVQLVFAQFRLAHVDDMDMLVHHTGHRVLAGGVDDFGRALVQQIPADRGDLFVADVEVPFDDLLTGNDLRIFDQYIKHNTSPSLVDLFCGTARFTGLTRTCAWTLFSSVHPLFLPRR